MDGLSGPGDDALALRPRFELGHLYMTPGAIATLIRHKLHPYDLLIRHVRGDWGDLDPEDRRENERALRVGERLLSSYHLTNDVKVWVITEADRSSTTLLLPSEY